MQTEFSRFLQLATEERLFREAAARDIAYLFARVDTGEILFATEPAATLFGYSDPFELKGLPVESLVHPDLRERHREYRRRYEMDPRNRPMGSFGMRFRGWTAQETEVLVEIELFYHPGLNGENCVLANLQRARPNAAE